MQEDDPLLQLSRLCDRVEALLRSLPDTAALPTAEQEAACSEAWAALRESTLPAAAEEAHKLPGAAAPARALARHCAAPGRPGSHRALRTAQTKEPPPWSTGRRCCGAPC